MAGSNEALADAFSGVVGTLVSLWCFYPIERIKTNLQAGKSLPTPQTGWPSQKETSEKDSDRFQRQLKMLVDLLRKSFRGCLTKSMHATSSSFCYFYFYSWILSYYNNKRRLRLQSGRNISDHSHTKLSPLHPSTRLVLSAVAAMMNTVVTLPLDVLSSKRTVECDNNGEKAEMDTTILAANSNSEADSKAIMDRTWKSIEKQGEKSPPGLATSTTCASSSSSSSSSTIEMVFHEACSRSEDLFALHDDNEDRDNENNTSINSGISTSSSNSNSILSNNEEYKMRWKERQEELKSRRLHRKRQLQQSTVGDEKPAEYSNKTITNAINIRNVAKNIAAANASDAIDRLRRWSKLWKGLTPALLLCSNPSIHYTVFDMLKNKLLVWKRLRNPGGAQQRQLSVSEAFVLGLLSKFVATIVTYPLIRAKVLMMVGGHTSKKPTNRDVEDESNAASKTSASPSTEYSPTLWSVLQDSYHRDGGIPGLYKGCDWQLIHTLLKSALMMAVREQITDKSRAMFGVSSK